MRKLIFVLTALALVLGACGGSEDSGAEADVTTSAAPTTTAAPETTTTTTAPETTTATTEAPGIVPGQDPDVDAIVDAYTVAFDSASDYETKAPLIDDPSGLEDTVLAYIETGDTMGGVSVVVTDVVINGEEADVTYDLLFNNNPTYPNLPGTAVLNDGGWQVPRSVFCTLMSSARVGCPSE